MSIMHMQDTRGLTLVYIAHETLPMFDDPGRFFGVSWHSLRCRCTYCKPSKRSVHGFSRRLYGTSYNSAVFTSLSANDYWVAEVPQNFLNPDYNFNGTGSGANVTYYPGYRPDAAVVIPSLLKKAHVGDPKNFTNAECINSYGTDYTTDFGNLLVVLHDFDTLETHYLSVVNEWIFPPGETCDQYAWICPPGTCSRRPELPSMVQKSSTWSPFGNKVAYCLAEPLPEHCRRQFSLILLLIVTAMNLLKCIVILSAAFEIRASPLMTTGDAAVSFLEHPDAQTENMCLNRISLKTLQNLLPRCDFASARTS